MAQRFLAPSVTFEGIITQNGSISQDSHLITRSWAKQNVINSIHSDSAAYAEVVSDGGVQKLKLKPLTVTSVTVNASETSFANFISNVYTGSNFQEGDIVFLTNAAISPIESYIHNGGSAGNADDWELVNSGLSDAQIRAKFSASSGINYNASTGAFTADQGEIRAFFSGASGITYNAGTGALTLDQGFTRGLLSASGILNYNSGTGAFELQNADVRPAIQADPAAGNLLTYDNAAGDMLVATSAVRGVLSGSGLISYNSGSGQIEITAATVKSQISHAAGSLATVASGVVELTPASVQGALSAGGLLSYSSGQFSIDTATVRNQLSAGGLLSYTGGQFSIDTATVRSQVSAGGLLSYGSGVFSIDAATIQNQISVAGGSLLSYSSGSLDLQMSQFRKKFQNQSLTANSALTLNHQLGEQLVHVSAMDGSGNHVDLQVVYTDANNVAVTSVSNLTGIDIAISM